VLSGVPRPARRGRAAGARRAAAPPTREASTNSVGCAAPPVVEAPGSVSPCTGADTWGPGRRAARERAPRAPSPRALLPSPGPSARTTAAARSPPFRGSRMAEAPHGDAQDEVRDDVRIHHGPRAVVPGAGVRSFLSCRSVRASQKPATMATSNGGSRASKKSSHC